MRYSFVGKNGYEVTDNFSSKITAKINRIAKLFPAESEANVTLSEIKQSKKVDVTISLPNKRIIKAEVLSADFMAAVDEVVDILEKQMVRYKNKLHDKAKKIPAFADELKAIALDEDNYSDEDAGISIVKSKKFFVKPMDAEEACMEMDMMGHNFFVFRNSETDEINVVYKRKDGAYGLIEPEM